MHVSKYVDVKHKLIMSNFVLCITSVSKFVPKKYIIIMTLK